MKLIAPDYYPNFICIADRCKHSCCVGWEIDIDPDTAGKYRGFSGEWGKRLSDNITYEGETVCFQLTEDERCPFLNEKGLCELVLQLGEDVLCQICTDHPRFRNFFSDRTEIGLGLCCEAACALVLTKQEPMRWKLLSDDGLPEFLGEEEKAFLEWREQLISCVQNRDMPLLSRVEQLFRIGRVALSNPSWNQWLPFFLELERMDDTWAELLKKSAQYEADSAPELQEWDIPFEQLLVYLIFRQLSAAFDEGDVQGRLAFILLIWQLLRQMFAAACSGMEGLIEMVRLYSSEIEYSDENIGAIVKEIHRLEVSSH